ncbi:hypothetical protein P9112_012255 [Eukaryota sp. TZLM1-RC]
MSYSVDHLRSRINKLKLGSTPTSTSSNSSLSFSISSPSESPIRPSDVSSASSWLSLINETSSPLAQLDLYSNALRHLQTNPDYSDSDFIRLWLDYVRLKATSDKSEAALIYRSHVNSLPPETHSLFSSDLAAIEILLSLSDPVPATPGKRLASHGVGTPSVLRSVGPRALLRRRKKPLKIGRPEKMDETVEAPSIKESENFSFPQSVHSPFATPAPQKAPTDDPSKRKVRFELPETETTQEEGNFAKETVVNEPKEKKDSRRGLVVNDVYYEILGQIGRGGSSRVFKALNPDLKMVALKVVQFDPSDINTKEMFRNEINFLKILADSDLIIDLLDFYEDESSMVLVLEFGEIDLNKLLQRETSQNSCISSNFVKLYFERMVLSVKVIHEERIVHGDLKPANFMLVAGQLKLIDFGIAGSISVDTTNIHRNTLAGTLNYLAPEAIVGQETSSTESILKVGRKSDVWSLGCILYQMIYKRPPFDQYTNMYQKLRKIPDPSVPIEYPEAPAASHLAIDLLKNMLVRNVESRLSVEDILDHPFVSGATFFSLEKNLLSIDFGLARKRLLQLLKEEDLVEDVLNVLTKSM